MKRLVLFGLIGALALSLTMVAASAATNDTTGKARTLSALITDFYGPMASAHGDALYVGSEMCLACHSGANAVHGYDTARWRNSLHARPFKEVADDRFSMVIGKGIVADSDQNGIDDFKDGLDFNADDQTTFEAYKPNAPVLGYSDATGYTMTIGNVTYQIFFTWGGNGLYKQRFVLRYPVTDRPSGKSGGTYVSPLQYNEVTHEWVPYHPEHWYKEDGTPQFDAIPTSTEVAEVGRSFDKRCSGCHFTGTTIMQDSFGEWVGAAAPVVLIDPDDPTYIDHNADGIKEETHIGCESCHGPGSRHILAQGDPTMIVKPVEDFTTKQANDACGACHVRGKSSNSTFGFPWDEVNDHRYVNGDDIANYLTEGQGLWGDGITSKKHHQQWHDFNNSSKPTFVFHEVKCYECHDPHNDVEHNLIESIHEEEDGESFDIATQDENNTLCLACHATHGPFSDITKKMVSEYDTNEDAIGAVVSAHTNHPYAPERTLGLSRCSLCHMPKTAKSAINYDISAHTFEAIPPEKTLMYNMPNSCSVSCHRNIIGIFGNEFDANIGTWNEQTDIDLANWLMLYYGPNGLWWQHSETEEGGETP